MTAIAVLCLVACLCCLTQAGNNKVFDEDMDFDLDLDLGLDDLGLDLNLDKLLEGTPG